MDSSPVPPIFLSLITPRLTSGSYLPSPSRSPTRERFTDNILSDLSPASTLEAFTNPSGKLRASIEAASPSERAFGIRASLASKKIQEWVTELSSWSWPAEGGFELPPAKRRKISDEIEPQYTGSLPTVDVLRYEVRVEEIAAHMEDLDVEEIKQQVLNTHFSARSRPSSAASMAPIPKSLSSYTKMDDFTAIVTTTVLQALPNLSRLGRLMNVWSVRLSVLRKVPPLLSALDDAEVALKSGWSVFDATVEDEDGNEGLSRETFDVMKDVLQDKVTTLGQDLDYMLDALESGQDMLPDSWLDRMEAIEHDYGEWVVAGDTKIRQGEWARMAKLRKEAEEAESARRAEETATARLEAEREAARKVEREAQVAGLKAERDAESARILAEEQAAEARKRESEEDARSARSLEEEEKSSEARRRKAENEAENDRLQSDNAVHEVENNSEDVARLHDEEATDISRPELQQDVDDGSKLEEERALEATHLKAEEDSVDTRTLKKGQNAKPTLQEASEDVQASNIVDEAPMVEIAQRQADQEAATAETPRQNAPQAENVKAIGSLTRVDVDEQISKSDFVSAVFDENQSTSDALPNVVKNDVPQNPKQVPAAAVTGASLATPLIATKSKNGRSVQPEKAITFDGSPDIRPTDSAPSIALDETPATAQNGTSISPPVGKKNARPSNIRSPSVTSLSHLLPLPRTSSPLKDAHANDANEALGTPSTPPKNPRRFGHALVDLIRRSPSPNAPPELRSKSSSGSSIAVEFKTPCEDLDHSPTPIASFPASPREFPFTKGFGQSPSQSPTKSITEGQDSAPANARRTEVTHKVIWGDTLRDIAAHYEVPLDDLVAANPQIQNIDLIYPDELVNIPASRPHVGTQVTESEDSELTHKVNWGDTLKDIAAHREVSLDDLVAVNPQIQNIDLIYPDELVNIPVSVPKIGSQVTASEDPILESGEAQEFLDVEHFKRHSRNSSVSGYSVSQSTPEILEAEPAEYFRPMLSPITSPRMSIHVDEPTTPTAARLPVDDSEDFNHSFSTLDEDDEMLASTPPNHSTAALPEQQLATRPSTPDFNQTQGFGAVSEDYSAADAQDKYPHGGTSTPLVARRTSLNPIDTGVKVITVARSPNKSPDTPTVRIRQASDTSTPIVPSSPLGVELEPFPEADEESPTAHRKGLRDRQSFDQTPPGSPLLSAIRKGPSLPSPTNSTFSTSDPSESSFLSTDAPVFDNVEVSDRSFSSNPPQTSDDQLQQQISSILQSIPSKFRLASEPNAHQTDTLRPKKTRRSVTPALRSHSSLSNYSRAPTPSFLLSPAYSQTRSRPRPQNGNPEIKLYHLSRANGEAPIKLFVRLVGENGERVMVRVGGGWADLGEYLKEYASHHGRRNITDNDKIEIQDLPSSRNVSTSSVTTVRGNGRSTPALESRPASSLERPQSSLNVRKARKSIGDSTLDTIRSPSTPLPLPNFNRSAASETPPSSGPARSSSRLGWAEDDSSLGLAGPKSKKVAMSERDQEWVDSMKEKVRQASAEKDRERDKNKKEFGEMDKVGGTKRLFRKG